MTAQTQPLAELLRRLASGPPPNLLAALGGASYPASEFWDRRLMRAKTVRQWIDRLDPALHNAEITHLSLEVLTSPVVAHLGYTAGTIRTVAVPRVAERIVRGGRGLQMRDPVRRDLETMSFMSEVMRFGYASPEGLEICRRVQEIHASVGAIRNDDQIYTLGQLIAGPERTASTMRHSPFSPIENDARWLFWRGIGEAMRLQDIPCTRTEMVDWMAEYEGAHLAPARVNHEAAEAHIRGLSRYFPGPLLPMARAIVVTTLDDRARECLMYAAPPQSLPRLLRGLWRAQASVARAGIVRLDRTWADQIKHGERRRTDGH